MTFEKLVGRVVVNRNFHSYIRFVVALFNFHSCGVGLLIFYNDAILDRWVFGVPQLPLAVLAATPRRHHLEVKLGGVGGVPLRENARSEERRVFPKRPSRTS